MNDPFPTIPTLVEVSDAISQFFKDRFGIEGGEDQVFALPQWIEAYLITTGSEMKAAGWSRSSIEIHLCALAFIVGVIATEKEWDTSLPGVGNE